MPTQLTAEEKASLLEGERIEAGEQQAQERVYEDAKQASEQELVFAGKFRTAEDLEKAYLELQKKLGSGEPDEDDQEEASDEDEDESPEDEDEGTSEEPTEDTEDEPEEETPSLSEEDTNSILESIGGEKTYEAALEWASDNLSEAEQDAYNRILSTADPNQIRFAVEALVGRFRSQADFQGRTVSGKPGGGDGAKPFRSRAEVMSAMADPRYDSDPAYRNDIASRLANSPENLL